MFDFVRRHTKIIMGVLFLLVIPSFVFLGIDGYTRFNEADVKVAEVNGRKITQTEWDNAHRLQVEQIRGRNPNIDLRLLDTPAMKYSALESLVRERVLAAAAADEHLTTSDQRLANELRQDPTVATLRKADGTLDMDLYRRLTAQQGLTPEGFEARVRADMSARQVLGGVVDSELISSAQADVTMDAFLERRSVRLLRFVPADYASKVTPTDADLETFYKANLARYQAPEAAKVEYVVLDLDSVKKSLQVSEDELRTYYNNNTATLGTPEERRVSHILIGATKDAPVAERTKAKTTATELLAQLRQAPGTFADVARKSSQDDVSAGSGGDLGFSRRDGKGIDPALLNAAYGLAKAGDLSEVIETDFGYHIVALTEIKPAAVPPFDKVRAQLEDQWRTQEAQRQFGETAEKLRNRVFEQADALKPVADELKLTLQTAENVQRAPKAGVTGPLANDRLLGALFSSDSLDKKRNTEAIEIGANQLAAARIVQYSAAHARPLAEVRDDVRTAFIKDRGAALARQEGEARLKVLTAQPAGAASLPTAVNLSRDEPQNQPAQLIEAVLRADPGKLPTFVGVDLGAEGYTVAHVEKVLPRAEHAAELVTQSRDRYKQLWTLAESRQYYELLKKRYKAKILTSAPAVQTVEMAAPR